MKTGRNSPCPCGSGKKYKVCCLPRAQVSTDFLYHKLSAAYDRLATRLYDIATETIGEPGITASLAEFLLWPKDEDRFENEVREHPMLYIPWLLFEWTPNPQDFDGLPPIPLNTTVAEMLLEDPRTHLDLLERRIIEAATRRPLSFYEVSDCRPGKSFRLKDIFLDEEYDVCERSGSQNAQRGDILFARVIQVDAVAMLAGAGAMLFPPSHKAELIRFRQFLKKNTGRPTITAADLDDFSEELRELFFGFYRRMTQPPQMQNTDGDALVFHRLHYQIDSAEETFEALKSLCVMDTPEDILAGAERDDAGRLRTVEFNWSRKGHKQMRALTNTILGHIEIKKNRLTVEVNSAERAAGIRREIEKRLSGRVRYRTTEIISPEAYNEPFSAQTKAGAPSEDELMQHPEVRQQVAHMLEGHWSGWIDMRIPALGGKTPRQAVKTADGRESVAALLAQAERDAARFPQMPEAAIEAIRKTRRELGLS